MRERYCFSRFTSPCWTIFLRLGAVVGLVVGVGALRAAFPLPLTAEAVRNPDIPGFRFPESEATITNWVAEMDRGATAEIAAAAFNEIHRHAWGLWAAVTAETAQLRGRQKLRVFETWYTPQELADVPPTSAVSARSLRARTTAPLQTLRQLPHGENGDRVESREASGPGIDRILGFVKFDPTAADHILQQGLFNAVALNQLLVGGAKQVPTFPISALALKCVFQVIKNRDLVEGRYFSLKNWSGPPDFPQAFPPRRWPSAVWIDVFDGGSGNGRVDHAPALDGSSREEETTYPLSSFIHFQLSAADAAALNAEQVVPTYASGDQAVLVAMHLAGREIVRWTWQTFWWTPDADNPPAPASAAIARLRPPQLFGAPRHYAMALAYSLSAPDQPQVGGENSGVPVYAYNPWLEAKFGPTDLPDSQLGVDQFGRVSANHVGVQSNCMSCHLRANYNPRHLDTAPRYSGARYVDLDDPQFVGTLQVDFLWSIPAHAH